MEIGPRRAATPTVPPITCSVFLFPNSLTNERFYRTFPKWDSPLVSADYIYIQTFKDLKSVKKKLAEKEKEAGFFNSEMKTKWLKLKKQQLDFLKDVETYNKFFIVSTCIISNLLENGVEVSVGFS